MQQQYTYAKVQGKDIIKYPFTREDLLKNYGNSEFRLQIESLDAADLPIDKLFEQNGIITIYPTDPPTVEWHENVEEVLPVELIKNIFYQQWQINPASEQEIELRTNTKSIQVREERNQLISASDWTQGKDIADSISLLWIDYRQALRDVTTQEGFPWKVDWPIAPG